MKITSSVINSEAVFSDDKKYRYKLTRTWDKDKKKATIIMLNPSKASELKSDRTVINVTNFLIDNNYGSINIVNLFAYMPTEPKELSQRNNEFEKYNDKYIIESLEKSDIVIVGWGSDNKKYISRKRQVEELLKPHINKIKCFKDDKGKKSRHPRDLTEKWTLENYEFTFSS